MACFLVPTGEAIVTTVLTKAFKSLENSKHMDATMDENISASAKGIEQSQEDLSDAVSGRIPFSKKLSWLNNMLWGGSALLAFEHIWHGEVVPWFPFLTAMESHDEAVAMLHEMSTVGVSMALLVTAAWGVMVLASDIIMKKRDLDEADELKAVELKAVELSGDVGEE